MIIPVRCFTCGKVLADKYDYYIRQVQALEHVQSQQQPQPQPGKEKEKEKEKHFDTLRTGKIMDDMGLTRYCCRRHMLSTVDMMDVI